jgi:membrane associated rhomboid family serine protease
MGYVGTLLLVAWLAAIAAFSINWFAVGRVDGELIRAGQWWRLFTALTLHADLAHLLGNIVFGTFFGLFAGRLLGSGVAWLAVALSAGLGNLLNVLVLESAHRSIGASTAVFAALGLVAGYVWHAKLMSQERWFYRLGPIVGGIALLAYTGMGGGEENVDVGAHVMGFISGFGCGIVLVHLMRRLGSGRIQLYAGMLALACIVVPWLAGLSTSHASS